MFQFSIADMIPREIKLDRQPIKNDKKYKPSYCNIPLDGELWNKNNFLLTCVTDLSSSLILSISSLVWLLSEPASTTGRDVWKITNLEPNI